MPSMIVWKCSCGSANARDHRAAAPAPPGAAARRRTPRRPPAATRRAWCARLRRRSTLVDDVVDFAAEGVQRRDRAAPLRRQEQEAVVEARAALRGLLLAVLVGRHRGGRCTPASAVAATRANRGRAAPDAPGRRRRRRRRCGRGCGARRRARRGSPARAPRQRARPAAARIRAARGCGRSRRRSARGSRIDRAVPDRGLGRRRSGRGPPAAGRPDPGPSRRDVLPEVHELQRGADRVGAARFCRGVGTIEVQQQAADRVRRSARVIGELDEGRVAAS